MTTLINKGASFVIVKDEAQDRYIGYGPCTPEEVSKHVGAHVGMSPRVITIDAIYEAAESVLE